MGYQRKLGERMGILTLHSMSKNQVLFSFLFSTLKDYDVSVYWRIVCIKTNIEDPTEFGYPLL